VTLAALLEDLAPAAREHEHVLVLAHQRAHVLARSADHARHRQEVPPDGHRVMRVVAEAADDDAPAVVELGRHERQVEEREDGVVPGEQGTTVGYALDPVQLRPGHGRQGRENRDEPAHLLVRRSGGQRVGGVRHHALSRPGDPMTDIFIRIDHMFQPAGAACFPGRT
jgi:hypothetical protein